MASRGPKNWALVPHGHHGGTRKVYRFQVLLPNGISTSLALSNLVDEMVLDDFLEHVKMELDNTPADGVERREIDWSGNIYLEDLLDRKMKMTVKFSDFSTKRLNILRLHDGESFDGTFENMWDLTPMPELLEELPAEYSTESALVDLIDNSLQAVWSNGEQERKLIRITIDREKIVIFDTGRGMDGSDENSITKWGTIGSSNHRVYREQGIGGKAPYLVPFFGMFGHGGTIASMHLGRTAIVSSKTKESGKVFTLHLSREALLKKSSSKKSKLNWKTAGGVRNPSEEEITLSPHRSFTQVEIHELKRHLEPARLRGYLKDIYFPYIQYDEDNGSMNTRSPVEFVVNDENLAETWGGEVTITNLHSSNGPNFVLDLKFSCTTQTTGAYLQAHARLTCVYFPIVKGKESINSILEALREEGSAAKQNFDKFPRVSIRRLGRLLPDARWGPLPLMEPKPRKGQLAELLKRCCKRVKCFVETDAGFYPTISKTDLAQHNAFTEALRCFGGSTSNKDSVEEVNVQVRKEGVRLHGITQLEKQYRDWIMEMHENYDEEMDEGGDEPQLIVNPSNKERLGISKDVIRVHTLVSRKGRTWRRGDHLKIQPGVMARMKSNFQALNIIFYGTLEYVVVEGFPGDPCGEVRFICRSFEFSDEQGCLVEVAQKSTNPDILIQESVSFPVSMIDDGKCQIMDEDSWNQVLKKKKEKAPAYIEIIRNLPGNSLGIGGDLPFGGVVNAGYHHSHEIVAVIRPQSYHATCNTSHLDKKYIVKDDELEMIMEIKHLPGSKDHFPTKLIDKEVKRPSLYNSINGLYIFQLSKDSSIFTKCGVYQFTFSVRCRDSSTIQYETTITVCPNSNSGCWQLFSIADRSADNTLVVDVRLGLPVTGVAVRSADTYRNLIPFLDIPKAIITILHGDDILSQCDNIALELSSDSLTLKVTDFVLRISKLDTIRPKYEAKFKISSSDNKFADTCPCRVKPGFPSTITMGIFVGWEKNIYPGNVIESFLLEVFDDCDNHVEEGTELNVLLDGLSFLDKIGSVRKVNTEGFVDLSGILRVVNGFGSTACLEVCHHEKRIFSKTFQIAHKELKAVAVPSSCAAGTRLENIVFEVSDSDGQIDDLIDGPHHTLSIKSKELKLVEGAQYAFKHGRCVVSNVRVPHEPGTVSFVAYHTHFPDLETRIKLHVYALDLVPVDVENESEPILSPVDVEDESEPILSPVHVEGESEPILSYPNSSATSLNQSSSSQHASGQPNNFAASILREISDEIEKLESILSSEQEMIQTLDSHKKSLEGHILNLKDDIDLSVGSSAKALARQKVENKIGTAAAVLCNLSNCEDYEGQNFMNDFVGIVALLGSVSDSKISRMLSVYLGEDDMLAVVCKTQNAARYIEKYDPSGNVDVYSGIHKEAANLGFPINRRFPIICLDAVKPYKGCVMWNSTQKELVLPCPHSKMPNGFKGFAVNMIDLSAKNMEITVNGYGLRQTLFYRLFGDLQVYETRSDMLQAILYLNDGAISLDGGVIKGNGMSILGYSEPEITFPVIPVAPDVKLEEDTEDMATKIRRMNAKESSLETVKNKIREREENQAVLLRKLNKKKRKFEAISEKLCGHPWGTLKKYRS